MDISVVIPLYNEGILPELHDWIRRVMEEQGYSTRSSSWMTAAPTLPGR